MIRLSAVSLAAVSLVGCASLSLGNHTQEVIEGDPIAYPAFEQAARSCSFRSIRRVSNGHDGSHFLIAYSEPISSQTRCLLDWLEREADGRLYRSGH
jgi:hypothetical protein